MHISSESEHPRFAGLLGSLILVNRSKLDSQICTLDSDSNILPAVGLIHL